jgi:hypothetical protein
MAAKMQVRISYRYRCYSDFEILVGHITVKIGKHDVSIFESGAIAGIPKGSKIVTYGFDPKTQKQGKKLGSTNADGNSYKMRINTVTAVFISGKILGIRWG